jgi:hypothetical protein
MNFSTDYRRSWVVKSTAGAGKKTVDLLPFELALVDKNTNQSLTFAPVVGKETYLACGSPNLPQITDGQRVNRLFNPLNTNVSFKSEDLGNVSHLRFVKADKADLTQVYYLGHNGIDACESLNFKCGETYQFNIHVKGQEVNNILGRYEVNEVVSVQTPCCDESCGCVNGALDCSLVIDDLLARFDSDLFWVRRFFDVEKIMSCEPAVTPPTQTNYTKYCLTLCDNGDEIALSKVQNQYPTVKVTVKERSVPYTTYEFSQLAATAAPAAFSQQDTKVKDCTNCPSGFTAVPAGYAYLVEIDNTNADTTAGAQLTAVQAVWATATYASKVNFAYGTSTYYVVASAALTNPSGDARIVKDMGLTTAYCNQTTAITTAWVSCGTYYKVTRDLCLTKANDDCQSNPEELAAIQAFYAGRTDIVSGSLVLDADSTDCLIRFNVSQYNNALLEDGCDTFGYDGAKFDSLPSYQGFRWEVCPCEGWTVNGNGCPVPPAADDKCCQCGLKFTTKHWSEIYAGCAWDINMYQVKDPIELNVSILKPDGTPMVCGTTNPTFRKTKSATYQTLKGIDVIREIIESRFDRQEKFANQTSLDNMLFLEKEGLKYGIVLNDYYNLVSITNTNTRWDNNPALARAETIDLYLHENDVVLYNNLKASLVGAFPNAVVSEL